MTGEPNCYGVGLAHFGNGCGVVEGVMAITAVPYSIKQGLIIKAIHI